MIKLKTLIPLSLMVLFTSCTEKNAAKLEFVVISEQQQLSKNEKHYWQKLKNLPEFDVKLHSDGCSGGMSALYTKMKFLHSSHGSQLKWRKCCEVHDRAYYYGGSKAEKKQADRLLNQCVSTVVGHKYLGEAMEIAVGIAGGPYLPTSYRWGYGEDFKDSQY